jgi:hypothetical protein
MPEPSPRRFMPSPRQIHWLIVIGFCSLGYAMYLRYLGIENTLVGLGCDGGLNTWMCLSRTVARGLYENLVFGWIALGAAVLNLLRPTVPMFAIALAASGLGLVLFNAALAGLAVGILIMSFARPLPERD